MICRDRAGAYAEGAHAGAPDVIQVADRWHLWDNLCQHVERLVASHHACLVPALDTGPGGDVVDPGESLWPDTTRVRNTRLRYEQTRELRERGLSMRAIARKLDLNFKTVRRYLHADSVETLLAGGVTASVLDPFKPYLHERVSQGVSNGTALLAEITERGYTGGYSTLAATHGHYVPMIRLRDCHHTRRRRRRAESPAGSPAFLATSTRPMQCA